MPGVQVFLANVLVVIMTATLLGLFWRRRQRLCWSFAAYAAAAVVTNRLAVWWPDRFYTGWFWTLKSGLFALLLFLIALELASMVFRAFPGARPAVSTAFVIALSITALGATWVPEGTMRGDYWAVMNHLQPRVRIGASWLFAAVAGLTYWYRIPLHEFHRDLLAGFTVDAVISAALWSLISRENTSTDAALRVAFQLATIAVALFWTRAAWRPEQVPNVPVGLVRELQPWRQ